jgi:DNA invertase Pin-like site-specific DNA recombinase
MTGQRIGYKRVSTVDQNTTRQLEGVAVDEVFEDKASGKSTAQRPALGAMLKHVRKGDVVLCHSMDRMARNLDDLRRIVLGLTSRGVQSPKSVYSGQDLLLSPPALHASLQTSTFTQATDNWSHHAYQES